MRPPAGEVGAGSFELPGWAHGAEDRPGRRVHDEATARVESRLALWNPAWIVVASSVALAALGVYAIDLATGMSAEGGPLTALAKRQVMFAGVGLAAAAVCAAVHTRRLRWWLPAIAGAAAALLVFVLIPFVPEAIVRPINGARRWINLGFMQFQPSEAAKVAFVLALAGWLRWRTSHRTVLGLMTPGLIAAVPMLLILVEPDLGTSLLFVPTLVAVLIAAGARLAHIFSACGAALAAAVGIGVASLVFAQSGVYPLLRPHQVERIAAVVDVYEGNESFADSRGFQGRQARMLIGAGRVVGHSEDASRALVHFSSLPFRHNDMVFAVLANRLGLVGVVGVLGLYAAWIVGALMTAAASKDPFGRLVVVGCAAMVATQVVVNLGMTLGLLPITGLTLPFVSYGGSSLVVCFAMVGMIMSVGLRRPEKLWRKSFEFDGR